MAKVTIYGASDDLIEVEGAIDEEFNPSSDDLDDKRAVLAFSDGTVLGVSYDGCWRFAPKVTGTAAYTKNEATNDEGDRPDGKPAYSDVVTLEGDIRWVVYGNALAKAK